jgi:cytochrome P450
VVSDAAFARDFFTVNNKYTDKDGQSETFFKKLLGESFLFSKGGDKWKAKRKACSHAFYKERLQGMMETFRQQSMKQLGRWLEEIEKSADGSTIIDISHEFERIYSRNIITVSFGEDISDEKFEIMKFTDKTFTKMVPKMVSIREAMHEIFE